MQAGTSTSDKLVRVGTTGGGFQVAEYYIGVPSTSINEVFTATSTTTYISVGYGVPADGQYSLWDNVSVKQIIPADWLGSELVVNGNFATDSDWTKGTGWSIAAGIASCDGSTNNVELINQPADLGVQTGSIYKTSFEVLNYTSGNVQIRVKGDGSGGRGLARDEDGIYIENLTASANSNDVRFTASAASSFDASIDNVSVKRLIEVAP